MEKTSENCACDSALAVCGVYTHCGSHTDIRNVASVVDREVDFGHNLIGGERRHALRLHRRQIHRPSANTRVDHLHVLRLEYGLVRLFVGHAGHGLELANEVFVLTAPEFQHTIVTESNAHVCNVCLGRDTGCVLARSENQRSLHEIRRYQFCLLNHLGKFHVLGQRGRISHSQYQLIRLVPRHCSVLTGASPDIRSTRGRERIRRSPQQRRNDARLLDVFYRRSRWCGG